MARSLGQFIAISKGDVADMRRLDMAPSRCTCRPFAGARSRGADPTSPGSQGVWWFAQVAVVSRMTTTRNALLTVPTPDRRSCASGERKSAMASSSRRG
jgi:hypothetical protein